MPSLATLVAYGSHPLAAQVVLDSQRVMQRGCCGPGRRQCGQLGSTGYGQVVRSEGHDTSRICRIPVGVVDIRRETVHVEDVTPGKSWRVLYKRRIETHVQRIGLRDTVVGNAETAPHNG